MSKIFLTDIDGVVLDFPRSFEAWVKHVGLPTKSDSLVSPKYYYKVEEWLNLPMAEGEDLVTEFFESEYSKHFIPYPDAADDIKYLKDNGWDIIALTAIGSSPKTVANRKFSLAKAFGEYAFSDVFTVEPFESKLDILKTFHPTIWVDDSPSHLISGQEAGHFNIHMKRPIDLRSSPIADDILIVNDWHGIINYMENENA